MDVFVGSEVLFESPADNSTLAGFVVQKREVQELFGDYDMHSDPYPSGMTFYKIRVYDVVDVNKESGIYKPPIICTVPATKIKKCVREQAEFEPDRRPPEVMELN